MKRTDSSLWPRWAVAPIAIVEPELSWPQLGLDLVAELEALLAPWLRDGVHHVGSTSIPQLPAKPIIDVMAGVESLGFADDIASVLRSDDWHYVPPNLDRRSWRRFFVKSHRDRRIAHLQVMTARVPRWRQQLLFRDRLRENATLRCEYAELKRRLAREHPNDREAYSAGKSDFVARVVTT